MATTTISKDINLNTSVVQSGPGAVAVLETPDDTISKEQSGETQKMATTQFVDDSVVVMRDESHVRHVDSSITKLSNPQESVDNLIDFLSKPIVLSSGTFALTDTFSIFNTFSMPYAALNGSSGLIWRQKLAGFFGIRMDMRFRIVVNANKFQQGRYIMGWTPLGGSSATTSNLKNFNFLYAHNATLVQRTTVPHVELDLSTNTVAELLVPFVSATSFYPLNSIISGNDVSSLGFISVYPYSALMAPTGSTTCGYTVYVSFENVSLYGAASAQAGKSHKGISGQEVANKNNGPISSISSAVSKGFKEFSNIPMLGGFAKDVSWIADRVTNVASIFGFSKPTAGDCIPKMMILNAPSHSTVDGDSDARAMSYLNQPAVVPITGLAGTDYDEMDFSYIKARYAWFNTFSWALGSTVGSTLATFNVNPAIGEVQRTVNGYNTYNYTPVSSIASQFAFWRGSIKFRFKVVKTEYHSGRLEFGFYPTDESSYIADPAYVNRVIVDIRDHSEVELIIPYISRRPWLPNGSWTGKLIVRVVDPLVAPSSVSPSLDILAELAGGDDIEFAVPGIFDYTPTTFTPQSGLASENVNAIISTTIGNMEVKGDPIVMSSTTIGDKVSSVRALTRRFVPINISGTNPLSTMNSQQINIVPDAILFWQGTHATNVGNFFTADTISYWGSMFTFMSGGIRIRDNLDFGMTNVSNGGIHTSVVGTTYLDSTSTDKIMSDAAVGFSSANYHRMLQDTSSNNTITVEVPQYTSAFTRCIADIAIYQSTVMTNATNYTSNGTGSSCRLLISAPSSLTVTPQTNFSFHKVYRAGSDDLNFSGYISCPPILVVNSSTASTGNY